MASMYSKVPVAVLWKASTGVKLLGLVGSVMTPTVICEVMAEVDLIMKETIKVLMGLVVTSTGGNMAKL